MTPAALSNLRWLSAKKTLFSLPHLRLLRRVPIGSPPVVACNRLTRVPKSSAAVGLIPSESKDTLSLIGRQERQSGGTLTWRVSWNVSFV